MTLVVKKLLPLFSLLFLFACDKKAKLEHIVGKTMGTTYSVKYVPVKDSLKRAEFSAIINTKLREINSMMSTYKRDSEITLFNKSPAGTPFNISKEFYFVLSHALEVSKKTEGFFDPTIGPLVNLWGFGPAGIKEVPSQEMIDKTLKKVGHEKIVLNEKDSSLTKTHPDVYLDLSASAKGHGVDAIAKILSENRITNFMVEIGGEVKTKGRNHKRPWRIAIETPDPTTNKPYEAVVELNDQAVATSGSYRNFYTKEGKTFSHTINPKTGRPITHNLVSVTVIDPDSCMKADTFATALMAIGGDKSFEMAKNWGLNALFIFQETQNGKKVFTRKQTSPNLKLK